MVRGAFQSSAMVAAMVKPFGRAWFAEFGELWNAKTHALKNSLSKSRNRQSSITCKGTVIPVSKIGTPKVRRELSTGTKKEKEWKQAMVR